MQLVVDLTELADAFDEATEHILLEIANELVNQLKAESPVGATGDLQKSWQIFQTEDGRVILGSNLDYAKFVQTGTRPHAAPFQPIQTWSRRKLGDASAAGPVWNKIREEGTEANPYIDRAVENTMNRLR